MRRGEGRGELGSEEKKSELKRWGVKREKE